MKRHPISMFRVSLTNYEEPVEVTVQGRVIGTWMPAGFGGEVRPEITFMNPADAMATTNTVTRTTTAPVFGQQLASKGGPDNPLE